MWVYMATIFVLIVSVTLGGYITTGKLQNIAFASFSVNDMKHDKGIIFEV